jgi:predicted O-linked N-acetylglucosamine transferase (SPINDLY family)
MFRIKPAKVSATWIGYNYTTGLKEIDYFITDDYQVLPTTKQFYSESILSLGETAYCFTPRDDFFCPDKLPMLTRGFITFGSFSRGIRLNPRVLDLWSKILAAIPRSRLKFDSRSFADFSVCAFFKNEFQSRGISPDRIDFGHTKLSQAMSEVDIVLDTFPHNSGTTLFETVYCGRPFVTMSGNLSLGRLGGSILKNLRLDQFISECEDDYIESAVNLSSQKNMLRDVSEFIRTEISKSPLMNSPKFMERFKAIVSQLTNN